MNNVNLIGRITKDIEVKYTQQGTPVASFTLAVNRQFKNKDGNQEADFINCVVWRKPAEILQQYTHKGSKIGVTGQIQTRNYENQQGQRVYVTEVVVNSFDFLDSKSSSDSQRVTNQQSNQGNQNWVADNSMYNRATQEIDVTDNDLPF